MRKQFLTTVFSLLIVALPVFGEAKEPAYHSANSVLFEIIENGVISSKRASLEFSANEVNGEIWAECKFSIITINDEKKRIEIDAYRSSTDDSTIKNIQLDSDSVSFDMVPFSLAPDRPLKLLAIRDHSEPHLYKVSAVGLWSGLWKKKDLVKIEWRQVPFIKLPYVTIGK